MYTHTHGPNRVTGLNLSVDSHMQSHTHSQTHGQTPSPQHTQTACLHAHTLTIILTHTHTANMAHRCWCVLTKATRGDVRLHNGCQVSRALSSPNRFTSPPASQEQKWTQQTHTYHLLLFLSSTQSNSWKIAKGPHSIWQWHVPRGCYIFEAMSPAVRTTWDKQCSFRDVETWMRGSPKKKKPFWLERETD